MPSLCGLGYRIQGRGFIERTEGIHCQYPAQPAALTDKWKYLHNHHPHPQLTTSGASLSLSVYLSLPVVDNYSF